MAWRYFEQGRSFYKSAAWAELSAACKRRDRYTCRHCGFVAISAAEKRTLHAHHRVSRRPVPGVTALDDLSNLITLCERCHQSEHDHVFTPSGRGFARSPGCGKPPSMYRSRFTRRR